MSINTAKNIYPKSFLNRVRQKIFFVTRRLVYLRGDNSYIYRIIAIFENTIGKRREFPISWYIYIYGVLIIGLGATVKRSWW